VHLRARAVCRVANPRHSYRYGCGLRLAAHPDPQRTLAARYMQKFPSVASTVICRSALALELHRCVASLAHALGMGCALRLALQSDGYVQPSASDR